MSLLQVLNICVLPYTTFSLMSLFNVSEKLLVPVLQLFTLFCFVHNTINKNCARTIHKKILITILLYYEGVMKTACECLCNVCLHKVIMYQLPSGLNFSKKCMKFSSFFFLQTKLMYFQLQNIQIYGLFNDKLQFCICAML